MARKSSLNSNEASYIPIPERDAKKASKNHDEAPPQHYQYLLESKTKTVSESLQVKTNPASCTSSPLDLTELIEEDVHVAVEFLQMMFPDYGEQSIKDVYFLNCTDLYEAIFMLNDLEEFDEDEYCETLDNNDNASKSAPAADDSDRFAKVE
ncbi:hypothetical protein VNO78_00977 [Psophocarpus tetragonolobus]|uniref:CUE domain-containing protein n=1 Tax=Psophocarpus tetragonolobus TaxID=3891 RepID=A0AAN9XUY7_PSOTE